MLALALLIFICILIFLYIFYAITNDTSGGYQSAPEFESTPEPAILIRPDILDKLDLTPDKISDFIENYTKVKHITTTLQPGDSCHVVQQVLSTVNQNVDKQAIYHLVMKMTKGKLINTDLAKTFIRLAIPIVMNRKYVSSQNTDKTKLDTNLDVNHVIQKEFRCLSLSSREAEQIRQAVFSFLGRLTCGLNDKLYDTVITLLVRGYGVFVTNLRTLDMAIDEYLTKANKEGGCGEGGDLVEYGLVKYNEESEKCEPTLKAKLYSHHLEHLGRGCSWDEPKNRITKAIKELGKKTEVGSHIDLVDGGYIEYDEKWVMTPKIYTIDFEPSIVNLGKCNIDDNTLYNDVEYFLKQSGYENYPPEYIYKDLSTFIKKCHGKMNQDDYKTMIANVSKAFTSL